MADSNGQQPPQLYPTNRPSMVTVEKAHAEIMTPTGVTRVPVISFTLVTESTKCTVFWPNELALQVADLIVKEATGLFIAKEIPSGPT